MTAASQALSDKTAARRPEIALLLVAPLLAGCGGARLSDEATAASAGPPPARLLVVTDGGQAIAEGADPALASRTASSLTETIVQGLRQHGIPAEIATVDGAAPDVARLSLALRRVEEGSRFERIALGFGLGQSRIEVTARLHAGAAPRDLLAFQGSAHSGYRPGLVMPLGVGLGAQSAMALVGAAGVGVAEIRGRGPGRDVRDLADAVVARTATYYREAGWGPHAVPSSHPDGGAAIAAPAAEAMRRG
ncbi:DUF4410 domain-containing protein [Neoroseomonas lacus]|uniref:DUF4410 domain-containing protein n=1 Tax=Neoroseomonas lacus TaxID=287609 RepID=A0A917NWP5_9PROT|nr:DUF4410 domain-containing protein [Neoroseomonas lacus]GGJ35429.1 hypothetical protein GCM10011320_48980 [Neoroseomonas lacus]